MIEALPVADDPMYICRDRGMVHFRKRGCPKVRMREPEGTPEFWRRYAELLTKAKNGELKAQPASAPKPYTWRWLCVQYFGGTTGLLNLDGPTAHARRLIIESTFDEPIAPGDPVKFGDLTLGDFTPKAVAVLRDRKKSAPDAANARVKAIRAVYSWALKPENDVKGITTNPARDITRLQSKRPGGHHTWTEDEVDQFQARHPIGTKAYLAMTLLLYCGGRLGDAIRLGKQHTRNGRVRYTQEKNHKKKPMPIDLEMPPDLQAAIDAGPVGDLTFLHSRVNRPFTKSGFGHWFKQCCRDAGLHHHSAHGLRKCAAVRIAHNRGTLEQSKATMGWRENRTPADLPGAGQSIVAWRRCAQAAQTA